MTKIDIIMLGNQGSGKTSLIKRFIKEEEKMDDPSFSHVYLPTIGIHFEKKPITIGDDKVDLIIWDTAGQEKFFSLTKAYFQKADGVVIVFDITDEESFRKIEAYWFEQIHEKTDENSKAILVGNKSDLYAERKVKFVDAHALASKYKMPYFETSAKTGENVNDAFKKIAKLCFDSIEKDTDEPKYVLNPNKPDPKRRCFEKLQRMFDTFSNVFSRRKSSGKEMEKITDQGTNH